MHGSNDSYMIQQLASVMSCRSATTDELQREERDAEFGPGIKVLLTCLKVWRFGSFSKASLTAALP